MIIKNLKLVGAKGFAQPDQNYPDEINIDMRKFDPGLIAFVGPNGAGKTTAMESMQPYPVMPGHPGKLANNFHLKGSLKEIEFEYGGNLYLSRGIIDGERGNAKIFLYENGNPVNKDGGIKDYAKEIERLCGPEKLYFRSVFQSQKDRGFSGLTGGEKKDLFIKLLGHDRYNRLVEAVKNKKKKLDIELAGLLGQLDQLKEQITTNQEKIQTAGDIDINIVGLQNEITACNKNITAKKTELERLKREAEQCLQSLDQIKSIESVISELANDKTGVESRHKIAIADFDKQIQAHTNTIERLQKCLSNADTIRSNIKLIDELTSESNTLTDIRSKQQKLNIDKLGIESTIDSRRQRVRQKIDEFNRSFLNNEKLADQLKTVPCSDTEFVNTCPLIKTAHEAQNKLAELEKQRAGIHAELKTPIPEEAELEILEKQISELPYDQERHIQITKELNELEKHDWAKLQSELDIAEATIAERRHQIKSIYEQEEKSQYNYSNQIKTIDERIHKQNIEINELRDNLPAYPDSLIRAATEELTLIERNLNSFNTRLGQLQAQLTALTELKDDTDKLTFQLEDNQKQHQTITNHITDFIILERAFGKNGIQPLEIDAACPLITSIASEIIQRFGKSWSISIATNRSSADNKKDIEDFEILVNCNGYIKNFDDLSPGQEVWVEQSLRKAITIYLIKHSGQEYKTIFQDEADGALDPERAQSFLETALKAHELTGAYYTFIITQRPEIWQQIPQRIMLDPEKGVIETVVE